MTPCVLVMGGLDPGGGAGLLADARAIHAAGAFACGVVTVLTVQSTSGMKSAAPIPPRTWLEQARLVIRDQNVRAIKIGALGDAANLRAAVRFVVAQGLPTVLDPVMLPSRGRGRLLAEKALGALRFDLVPRVTLVTANVAEAEAITGLRVTDVESARVAAKGIVSMGAGAALVKGGHLKGPKSIDVLATHDATIELAAPRHELERPIHGGGCFLASLIAARLALGDDVTQATQFAKRKHQAALTHTVDVGGKSLVLV